MIRLGGVSSLVGLLILTCSAIIRFETLSQREIWHDEAYSLDLCHKATGFKDVLRSAKIDAKQHPPLHYLVVWSALKLRDSAGMARAPSAVAGVVSLLAWFGVAYRLGSPFWGLCSLALGSFSLYHINYSMDARPYSLLVAFVSLQYLAYFSVLHKLSPWRWLLFVFAGAGALYTSHFGILHQCVLGASAVAGVLIVSSRGCRHDEQLSRRGFAWSLGGLATIGVLYLPQLRNLTVFLGASRLRPEYRLNGDIYFFRELIERWGSGPGWQVYLWTLLLLIGIARILVSRRLSMLTLIGWLLAPIAAFLLVPFRGFFDIRYIITALPAFFIIVGLGVATAAELGSRVVSESNRRFVLPAVAALIVLQLHLPSVINYSDFRSMETRCSEFFQDRSVLDDADGFCRKHILLNSILKEDRRILKPVGHPN